MPTFAQIYTKHFDYYVATVDKITADTYDKSMRKYVLPAIGRYLTKPPTQGWRFIDLSQVPKMLKDIDKIDGINDITMLAFWVLVHTGLRRSEVVYAQKDEFDLPNKIWTIPASRMKIDGNGDHIVPLSDQVIQLIEPLLHANAHTSRLWTIDAIELTLSHKIRGVRGVYNHANMLDERRELLQWWANEVDKWRGVV